MPIRKFPDPVLRIKTSTLDSVGDTERKLLEDMARSMYFYQGVGLAANQVGLTTQLAVVNIGDRLIKMVNPVITRRDGSETQEEGCLSLPNTTVKVKRARKISVQYLDENCEFHELKADGLLARAIQHEIDHLNGTMIIDYLSPLQRAIAKRRLARNSKIS